MYLGAQCHFFILFFFWKDLQMEGNYLEEGLIFLIGPIVEPHEFVNTEGLKMSGQA